MKILWCWRCRMEIPMLDEEEYSNITRLTLEARENFKYGNSMKERFQPILDYYNEITGFGETVANAVFHHRISLYGPPCKKCGKPYRTPKATFCAACGNKRIKGTNGS